MKVSLWYEGVDYMSVRDREVLNMQLVLIPILAEEWNKSYSELSDIFSEYDVLSYMDICYLYFCEETT